MRVLKVYKLTRLSKVIISLAFLFSISSFAQYGGGMGGTMGTGGTMGAGGTMGTGASAPTYGSSAPSYGHGKAIGISLGAAALGAAGLYVLVHRGSSVTGCVQPADDGLRLVDENGKRSFSLLPNGAAVVPGERVRLRGKVIKEQDGAEIFEAKKLMKNLGPCGESPPHKAANKRDSHCPPL